MEAAIITPVLAQLASNKYFIGVAMIVMNLGSRFVIADISKAQESLINNEVFKKLVVFCIFFISTRDILVACMLAFAFNLIVYGMFNEHKRYNIVKHFLPNHRDKTHERISYRDYLQWYGVR